MSNDSTLFVQGVPEGVTQAQFQTAVNGAAKEVKQATLNERKRFAHVTFESHDAAEKGLKALKKAQIGGQTLDFEWSVTKEASNKVEFDEASNKAVYVRGLATSTDIEEVKTAFEDYGELEEAFIVNDRKTKSSRGQAVLKFKTRSAAEKALELNETELGGQTITVEFAKAPRTPRGGRGQSNGGSAKKPAQKRKASDDEEETPAKKAKSETPKTAKKETPKKETAAASTKKETTPKKETSPKETTPKKSTTPSKAKGKK